MTEIVKRHIFLIIINKIGRSRTDAVSGECFQSCFNKRAFVTLARIVLLSFESINKYMLFINTLLGAIS